MQQAGLISGSLSVQLAHLAGLRVVAAAQPRHHDALRALGADDVVPVEDLGHDVRRLAPGAGAHISLVVRERPPALRAVRSVSVAVRADWRHLTLLAALADSDALRVEIAGVLPLADAALAHRRQASGGVPGRLLRQP